MCGVGAAAAGGGEGGRRRVGGFTMPPHVLPDLKRNEPVVTPAVRRQACAWLGSGDLNPSSAWSQLPPPQPRPPPAKR